MRRKVARLIMRRCGSGKRGGARVRYGWKAAIRRLSSLPVPVTFSRCSPRSSKRQLPTATTHSPASLCQRSWTHRPFAMETCAPTKAACSPVRKSAAGLPVCGQRQKSRLCQRATRCRPGKCQTGGWLVSPLLASCACAAAASIEVLESSFRDFRGKL
jgi:hypothetical protein